MTHERSTIMLKRSTIMLIGGLFILISLVGCQRKDKYTALLLRADSIMYARPDSALFLLNSITNPRKMRAECYRSQGFYDKAMEMYRTSYKIDIENNDRQTPKKRIYYSPEFFNEK